MVILIIFVWPLFWIPLVCNACKSPRQRPIYGPPGTLPPQHAAVEIQIPTGAPVPVMGAPVVMAPPPPPPMQPMRPGGGVPMQQQQQQQGPSGAYPPPPALPPGKQV